MNDSPKRNSSSSQKYNGSGSRRKNYNKNRQNNSSSDDSKREGRSETNRGDRQGDRQDRRPRRNRSRNDGNQQRRGGSRRDDQNRNRSDRSDGPRNKDGQSGQSRDNRRRREDPRRKKRSNYRNKKTGGSRNNRNNRSKGNQVHKDYSKGPLTPRKIPLQYEYLLNEFLKHRRNYFQKFHSSDKKHVRSLQNKFYQAMDRLRNFEDSLKEDWAVEALKNHLHEYPVDTDFSDNHQEPFTPEPVDPDFVAVDIHFENVNPDHELTKIDEESVGSMEDYFAYKGKNPEPKKPKKAKLPTATAPE